MAGEHTRGTEPSSAQDAPRRNRFGLIFAGVAILLATISALALPKGYTLAVLGDTLQFGLIAATMLLTFRNFLRSHSRVRIFWGLTFAGMAIWTTSTAIWAFCEVWLKQPVPDSPIGDTLLCVQIVPLTTAFAAAPHRERSSRFRAFGLLDVSALMIYALYLYNA